MTQNATTLKGPFAGFWIRVLARVIDVVLVGGALITMEWFVRGEVFYYDTAGQEGFWLLLGLLAHWFYFAGMHSSEWQATLGKRLLGLRVTDSEGRRLSFARATGRYFAEYLSALILLIGYLMVAFTERKQGLHDLLANTFVLPEDAGAAMRDSNGRHESAHRPRASAPSGASQFSHTPMHAATPDWESGSPPANRSMPAAGAGRRWVLAGFSDTGEVQRVVIEAAEFGEAGGELVLGRNADHCHIVLDDMTVSGVHGRLRPHRHGLEMLDLESTNGTTINGVPLAPNVWQTLADGDLVAIGGAELRLFLTEG